MFFTDTHSSLSPSFLRPLTFRKAHKRKPTSTSTSQEESPPQKVPKVIQGQCRDEKVKEKEKTSFEKNESALNIGKKLLRKWELQVPSHFPKTKYFTVLLVAAYYLALFHENVDPATWRMLRPVFGFNPEDYDEACNFLQTYLKPFEQLLPCTMTDISLEKIFLFFQNQHISLLDLSGTFEFDCQIHVFHKLTGTLLSSYPETYDDSKRQLYFLATKDMYGALEDISIIENIASFYKVFGVYCFFCQKFFRGRGTQHKCKKINSCFVCRRPFLKTDTYVTKVTKQYFCDANLTPNTAWECKECFLRILTPHCAQHHKQRVCRWGILCTKCNKYIFESKFQKKSEILKTHICGVRQCYFCGQRESKENHQCQIRLPKFDSEFTNLAFLNFEYVGNSPIYCRECFFGKMCSWCHTNKRHVNICTALVEVEERENFDCYTFADFCNTLVEKKYLEQIYLPVGLRKRVLAEKSKNKFGRKTGKNVHDMLFLNSNMSCLEKFFHFVAKKCVNTTFVFNDECGNGFEEIIHCLYQNGIKPKIIGSPKIFVVEVPELDIRFVNLENYMETALLKEKNRFFPQRWIQQHMYEYNSTPPKIEDFFCFFDSEQIIKQKELFVSKLENPWNFKRNLCNYSIHQCLMVAKLSLQFLSDSFQSQQKLCSVLKSSEKDFMYVHPFNKPLFTKAAYAFKLLTLFCPLLKNVKVLKSPVHMTSSHNELEYCFYQKWLYPQREFIDAWSPNGQKKFPEAYPDLYCVNDKTCTFWNGCLVHGHPVEQCLFKRKKALPNEVKKNMFGIDLHEAFQDYTRKKDLLQKNHPDLKVVEIWHCEWRAEKSSNKKLQEFLRNIYRNPPLYRLDPRAAGELHVHVHNFLILISFSIIFCA